MRKLAIFSAAFAAATAVCVYLNRDARMLLLAGAFLLFSPAVYQLGARRISVIFLGLAAGVIWTLGYNQIWLGPVNRASGQELTILAQIQRRPDSTDFGACGEVALELEGRSFQAVLYADKSLLNASAGDWISCRAAIASAGSDYLAGESLYLRADGRPLKLYAVSDLVIRQGKPSWTASIRLWLQQRINACYGEEEKGLVMALVTGDQSWLTYSTKNDLAVAGLRHVVAVSGMHISILITMVTVLCGYHPRLSALLGMPLLLIFTLVSGAALSACRAAIMQAVLLAAPLLRREHDPLTSLSAAALLLLLYNPWAIASISFQLSFSAAAGIMIFSGKLQERLLWKKENGKLHRLFVGAVVPSLSATIAAMPFTVIYFGMISLCAPLCSVLVLWTMPFLMGLGLLSCIPGPLSALLVYPVSVLSRMVLRFAGAMGKVSFSAAYGQNLPLMIWVILAYGIGIIWILRKKRSAVLPLLIMSATLVICLWWGRWTFGLNGAAFHVLDVGQGQAVLITDGKSVAAVDCGGSRGNDAGEAMVRTLHSAGRTHLDVLILTHYDADHTGGVEQLLHRVSVGAILLPDTPDPAGRCQQICQAAERAGVKTCFVRENKTLSMDGCRIEIFAPIVRDGDRNSGICILATVRECDILITGDLDKYMEMRLLSRQKLPPVEVLIAGHHGAADSTCRYLLDAVNPRVVVISVGKGNRYGHPAEETLNRITASGAEICRTDLDGTVVFQTNGR